MRFYFHVWKGGEGIMAFEDTLFTVLFWSGPIGLGVFFVGLGYLIKCVANATKKENRSKESKD
jgi:hypothetical protein